MAFTLRTSGSNQLTGTSITVALTGIGAGDMIVLGNLSQLGSLTINSVSDGSASVFTGGTVNTGGNKFMQIWYCLSSVATGSVTYTVTYSASHILFLDVYAFTPSGTASFDAQDGTGSGNSTALASGNITTTSTDGLVFGYGGTDNVRTLSAPLVNGVAATASIGTSNGNGASSLWYLAESSTFTGNVSCTMSSAAAWNCNAMAFKNAAGGASVPLLGQACL